MCISWLDLPFPNSHFYLIDTCFYTVGVSVGGSSITPVAQVRTPCVISVSSTSCIRLVSTLKIDLSADCFSCPLAYSCSSPPCHLAWVIPVTCFLLT